jgi:hypothetical protein
MLPIFFYHNTAQSLAHKGFRRIVTPPATMVKKPSEMTYDEIVAERSKNATLKDKYKSEAEA